MCVQFDSEMEFHLRTNGVKDEIDGERRYASANSEQRTAKTNKSLSLSSLWHHLASCSKIQIPFRAIPIQCEIRRRAKILNTQNKFCSEKMFLLIGAIFKPKLTEQ